MFNLNIEKELTMLNSLLQYCFVYVSLHYTKLL